MNAETFRKLKHSLLAAGTALSLVGTGTGCAPADQNPLDSTNLASTTLNLKTPGELATGSSTIEGRYVYAPPDEGEITIPLSLGGAAPGEFLVADPSMVAGSASVRIVYSKKKNTVDMYAKFIGLPYRPSYHKDFDNSTPFNKQYVDVKDAHWQIWLVGSFYARQRETFYYSLPSLDLLGSVYDFAPLGPQPMPAAGTYTAAQIPVLQMVCSPEFEASPNGQAEVHFRFQYDRIADASGTPGTINAVIPFKGCAVDGYSEYYTSTRLPDAKFMTWDTFLQSVWNGEGITVATSAEPYPKPAALNYRDNTFVGWSGMYPYTVPKGFAIDGGSGTLRLRKYDHPVSMQLPLFPPSRRNTCQ